MTENQKLREALRIFAGCATPVDKSIDARGHAWSEAYLDQALLIARQALALPTAAPVGEREAFEQFAQNCPMGKYNVTRRGEGYDSSHTQIMWDAWKARAALSAGDAVDAQRYRWLRDEAWAGYNQGKGFPHVFTIDGAGNRRTMLAEDALDASIDAAMRKDKP